MYVVTVTFSVKGDHFDDFLMAVKKQAADSLQQEPDCSLFDVCVNEDANAVFLYELYTDKQAFDLHLQSNHFAKFNAKVTPWTDSKQVGTWSLVSGNL